MPERKSKPIALDPEGLGAALAFAASAHGGQTRKGTDIPYVSHLLAVAGLVLEHGGAEIHVVAALLHDTLEDCEGVTRDVLEANFGRRVAGIVVELTDTGPGDKPGAKGPWKERKSRYLDHLADASRAALLVGACDKLHNLGSLVRDLRVYGPTTLARFRGRPADQAWYFSEFARRIAGRVPAKLVAEIERLLAEYRVLAGIGSE